VANTGTSVAAQRSHHATNAEVWLAEKDMTGSHPVMFPTDTAGPGPVMSRTTVARSYVRWK
jgi:hypothetical protein